MAMMIYLDGWDAAQNGITENPHDQNTPNFDYWQQGYNDYFDTLQNDLKNGLDN